MGKKNESNSLIATQIPFKEESQQLVATTPMALLTLAINQNLDMDKLERLMVMNDKWVAQKAKEAFLFALSNFQADCPEIKKIRKVNYVSKRTQETTKYNFASLGDIEKQIKPAMQHNGLSKRWEIHEEKDQIIVTCLVTHKDGHTEMTAMRGKLDDSGGKNDIQKAGSTISYLERYSLLAALGISTADTDDDGRGAGGEGSGVDLPLIKEDEYKKSMGEVIAGRWTVDHVLKSRSLKPEQKTALETAERSFKNKGNETKV